jgi:hypothetical protein
MSMPGTQRHRGRRGNLCLAQHVSEERRRAPQGHSRPVPCARCANTAERLTESRKAWSADLDGCRSIRLPYRFMDVVAAMQVFVRVAEAGGFTSVARETRTTQPRVSCIVAALEDHLGARLFHRSTRGQPDRVRARSAIVGPRRRPRRVEQFPQLRRRIRLNVLQLFGAI